MCIYVSLYLEYRIYILYYNYPFFFEDSMYEITDYTRRKAKELGVEVRPSVNSKKKVDVWRDGKRIASIGAYGYMDFPSYLEKNGEAYAKERQRLYKIRNIKNRTVKGSNGWWSDNLLW